MQRSGWDWLTKKAFIRLVTRDNTRRPPISRHASAQDHGACAAAAMRSVTLSPCCRSGGRASVYAMAVAESEQIVVLTDAQRAPSSTAKCRLSIRKRARQKPRVSNADRFDLPIATRAPREPLPSIRKGIYRLICPNDTGKPKQQSPGSDPGITSLQSIISGAIKAFATTSSLISR